MAVAYVLDGVFETHEPPGVHPERPERLAAVRSAFDEVGLATRGRRLATRQATESELGRVHTADYIAQLARDLPDQSGWLDADTYYSPGTWNAALCAAGAAIDLTDAAMRGEAPAGIAAVRPPGHHAEADHAMGFCLLNNIAIAAAAARAGGAAKVAIVDWDVHHGNGTQHAFEADPNVLFLSVHQYPLYPGTGSCDDVGVGAGRTATVNVGLPAGSGDNEYIAAFDEVLLPKLRAFEPDILFISAGFDASEADPLAGMNLTSLGYAALAARVCKVADEVAQGRLIAVLEGGYDLGGLGGGVSALAAAMLGGKAGRPAQSQLSAPILPAARDAIDRTLRAQEVS